MEWDRLEKTSVTIQPSPYPSSDSSTTKTHLSSPATRSLKSSRGADSELGGGLALPDRLLGGSEPKFSQQEGCWKWGSGRRGGGADPALVAQGQGSAHVWCLELLAALSVSEQGAPARASPVAAVLVGALAPFGALPAAPSCWVPS